MANRPIPRWRETAHSAPAHGFVPLLRKFRGCVVGHAESHRIDWPRLRLRATHGCMRAHDRPPSPPEIDRRLQFHREQWLLLPLMFAVPILAALGLLGGPRQREEIELRGVGLAVEFAPREHFEDWSRLRVTVVNRSSGPLAGAQAEFSRGLLEAMGQPSFQPPLARIDADWYVVPLGDVAPGATRGVTLDYRSTSPGVLAGAVRVRAGDEALAELPVHLTVLP
jgi:hypothetical protein